MTLPSDGNRIMPVILGREVKNKFYLSGVYEINMKTLSGCANSLCVREVFPAKLE